jgi:predicted nucleotidyltransferase component of viral defense system
MKLKIEINTREHFNVLGLKEVDLQVQNGWFNGVCNIPSYELEELLGTKLRALYQRSKSRDLFDLYWAYQHHSVNTEKLLKCYRAYMDFDVAHPPTQKVFIANMEEKMNDRDFTGDINMILRPGVEYDNEEAYEFILKTVLENI